MSHTTSHLFLTESKQLTDIKPNMIKKLSIYGFDMRHVILKEFNEIEELVINPAVLKDYSVIHKYAINYIDHKLFSNFLSLRKLDIGNNLLTKIPDISILNNLEELDISCCLLTELNIEYIPVSINKIIGCNNLIELFPDLNEFKHLSHISLSGNKISQICAEHIPINIKVLNLYDNLISNTISFSNFMFLEKLTLFGNKVVQDASEFRYMENMKVLILDDIDYSNSEDEN